MLRHLLLLSLSLLSVTAFPTPSETLAILAARGIDPRGPIPADATPIDGGYTFAADSDAAHWSVAQAFTPGSTLGKRDSSGLSMTMWSTNSCGGSGAFFGNVQYGASQVGGLTYYQSIQFNGRALLSNEQADFSYINLLNGDRCATFQGSLGGRTPAGCYSVGSFSCFRLNKH